MSNINETLSVVMCAYTLERWPNLVRAIASIQRQTIPADEIILVIDHNPALFERAREAFREVVVIENREERGLSGARNSGIHHTHGQIIAFIDEDAVASSDWLESLLRGYTNKDILGVGGEVRPLWTVNAPGWFPDEFNWVVGCSYKGLPEGISPIRNPIGCNMSFKRDALLAAGGFRNGIGRIGAVPVGCEETELSIRIRQIYAQATILYQPQAVVYHRVPTQRANWKYFLERCYAEGLSKAQVTHFVGSNDGLSSERSYVAETLPKGVINGMKEAFLRGNLNGLSRAVSIVAGLGVTTLGYLIGVSRRKKVEHPASLHRPGMLLKPERVGKAIALTGTNEGHIREKSGD